MIDKEARKLGIGGSDIGAIFDAPTAYKSAYELYMEKVHGTDRDISNEAPIIWGNLLEEPIAQHYSKVTGKELHNPAITHYRKYPCVSDADAAAIYFDPEANWAGEPFIHKDYPFLFAHPDRLVKCSWRERKGLEIKTANSSQRHLWGEGGRSTSMDIPLQYYYQICHYMLVLDYPSWDVAVLFGGQEFKIYNFERDYDMDELIITKATEFWNEHVLKQIPPARNFEHAGCRDFIKREYNQVDDKTIEMSDDFLKDSDQLFNVKEQIKEYQRTKEKIENKILAEMGNCSVGKLSNGNYFFRRNIAVKEYTVAANSYTQLHFKRAKG